MANPYQIALTLIDRLGNKSLRQLAELYPQPEEVFSLPHARLKELFGKHLSIIQAIEQRSTLPQAEQQAKELEKHHIKALFFTDPMYPVRLNQSGCEDSPALLYVLGECDLNPIHSVAVVGTRKATDYGRQVTAQLVDGLRGCAPLVVSGLAYGIDTAAHQAALDSALPTVAVLGHGLDRIYPAQNRELAKRILAAGGALVTEYPLGTAISASNFPARNRIIAALSDATVVVEATERGGALITANMATGYHRDVFAVPGRLDDPNSAGCNNLIVNNKAILIRNAGDLCFQMGWDGVAKAAGPDGTQQRLFVSLTEAEQTLVRLLTVHRELTLEEMCANSTLSLPKIAAVVMELELKNVVRCLPGRLYKLV